MQYNWNKPSSDSIEHLGSDCSTIAFNKNGLLHIKDTRPAEYVDGHIYLSSSRKIIIRVHPAYFHIITETVPIVVDELERSKEKLIFLFILPPTGSRTDHHIEHVLEYIARLIVARGHEVKLFHSNELSNGESIEVNNFVLYNINFTTLDGFDRVVPFLKNNMQSTVAPFRKVYLSRGKTLSNAGNAIEGFKDDSAKYSAGELRELYKYKNNSRMDDERLVEQYMVDLGFEVIYPEDIDSYEDQIRLMLETKTLASVTSAGLTSLIFMSPGCEVIEFSIPLVISDGSGENRTAIHNHYSNFSLFSKLIYTSVPHDGVAVDFLNLVKSTGILDRFKDK